MERAKKKILVVVTGLFLLTACGIGDTNTTYDRAQIGRQGQTSTGKIISQHNIEGIGDDFVPDLFDKNQIDDILLVNDDDSINMARKISRELGIGVGISSGTYSHFDESYSIVSYFPLGTIYVKKNTIISITIKIVYAEGK